MKKVKLLTVTVLTLAMLAGTFNFNTGRAAAAETQQPTKQMVNQTSSESVPAEQNYENDLLKINKTATQVGKNEFDVELKVKVSEDVKVEAPGASVVMVMDISGSMKLPFNGTSTRVAAAKTAANAFVDSFLSKENGKNNELAFVTYDYKVYGTLNFGHTGPYSLGAESIPNTANDINKNATTFKQALNSKLSPVDGATNIQGALKEARSFLASAKNKNKYVILFSDGVPNITYEGVNTEATSRISNVEGYGSNFYVSDFNYGAKDHYKNTIGGYSIDGISANTGKNQNLLFTISEGMITEKAGADIYTIYANDDRDGDNDEDWKQANYVMKNVASVPSQAYAATNEEALIEAFDTIATKIKVDLWNVVDPMAEGVEFVKVLEQSGNTGESFENAGFDSNSKTLNWNLLNAGNNFTTLNEGGKAYK
ncbi:MAG: vWA domain-containing protein, partial [Anaerovoracaceae bacterium]